MVDVVADVWADPERVVGEVPRQTIHELEGLGNAVVELERRRRISADGLVAEIDQVRTTCACPNDCPQQASAAVPVNCADGHGVVGSIYHRLRGDQGCDTITEGWRLVDPDRCAAAATSVDSDVVGTVERSGDGTSAVSR